MDINEDLISVLIPVYNVEMYLEECLVNVLNQTYKNIEIVLLNDGSRDSSGLICDKFANKDKRVKVIHTENKGQAHARNTLIDTASGDYYVFVDSDDIITPTYIEDLYKLTQKYKCKIAVTILKTFKDGEEIKIVSLPAEECCVDSLQAIEWMNYQIKLDTWPVCKIYHKSIFENKKLRYPTYKISEDLALTFVLLLESDSVAYSNKIDYYYRLRNNSTDRQPFSKIQMDAAVQVIEYMDQYQHVLQPIIKSYICRKVSFAFRMLIKMPEDYNNAQYFRNIIKTNRLTVLMDRNARLKTKMACFISFLGISCLKIILKIYGVR